MTRITLALTLLLQKTYTRSCLHMYMIIHKRHIFIFQTIQGLVGLPIFRYKLFGKQFATKSVQLLNASLFSDFTQNLSAIKKNFLW